MPLWPGTFQLPFMVVSQSPPQCPPPSPGAPTVSVMPPGPVTVKEGKSLSLECLGRGEPRPLVRWSRLGSRQKVEHQTLLHMDSQAILQVRGHPGAPRGPMGHPGVPCAHPYPVCPSSHQPSQSTPAPTCARRTVPWARRRHGWMSAWSQHSGTPGPPRSPYHPQSPWWPGTPPRCTAWPEVWGAWREMYGHAWRRGVLSSTWHHGDGHGVVVGDPAPRIEWSKLRAPLPWQHRVVNGSLVIPRAAQQDSGQYICNASSPLGSTEAFVTLDVESKKGTARGWGAPGLLLPPPLWPSPVLPLLVATSVTTSTLTSSPSSWAHPAPLQHSSSSSQALLKLHHQPFPWVCPPACPIPVHVPLHFCSLIHPSSHSSWIYPWLIPAQAHLYLCSYLSFHLFLMDPSISFIPAHTHLYLLTLTSFTSLWIHPSLIHHSSCLSLYLC